MKCNQSCPGIELVSPYPYPVTITITQDEMRKFPIRCGSMLVTVLDCSLSSVTTTYFRLVGLSTLSVPLLCLCHPCRSFNPSRTSDGQGGLLEQVA